MRSKNTGMLLSMMNVDTIMKTSDMISLVKKVSLVKTTRTEKAIKSLFVLVIQLMSTLQPMKAKTVAGQTVTHTGLSVLMVFPVNSKM